MTHIPKADSKHIEYFLLSCLCYDENDHKSIIYSAISNEVPQLCCESTVYRTSLEIRRHQLK